MQHRIRKLNPEINPVTFKDGRGIIQTYYPEQYNIVEWNYIVTLKGAVRGHHYHKEFDEYIIEFRPKKNRKNIKSTTFIGFC